MDIKINLGNNCLFKKLKIRIRINICNMRFSKMLGTTIDKRGLSLFIWNKALYVDWD